MWRRAVFRTDRTRFAPALQLLALSAPGLGAATGPGGKLHAFERKTGSPAIASTKVIDHTFCSVCGRSLRQWPGPRGQHTYMVNVNCPRAQSTIPIRSPASTARLTETKSPGRSASLTNPRGHSSEPRCCPDGGIGRRASFRCWFLQGVEARVFFRAPFPNRYGFRPCRARQGVLLGIKPAPFHSEGATGIMSVRLHKGDLPDLSAMVAAAIDTKPWPQPARDRLCVIQPRRATAPPISSRSRRARPKRQTSPRFWPTPASLKLFHFARFDMAALYAAFDDARAGLLHQDRLPARAHLYRPARLMIWRASFWGRYVQAAKLDWRRNLTQPA